MSLGALSRAASRAGVGACLILSLGAPSGCALFGPDTVDRRFHGRTVEGPFVSPEAYAAMVRGSVHEASGALAAARREYSIATREAPELAEPWAHLGAVACRLGEDPTPAFRRALSLDASLATVWTARARCLLVQKRPVEAVAAATRAMELGPGDVQTSLLLHEALRAAGDGESASKIWGGMRARWPDDPRIEAAANALAPAPRSNLDALDTALCAGDEARAERLASVARLPLASLALRAAACGRLSLAGRVAALVFRADPTSTEARIALLVSADLQRNEPVFREALGGDQVDKSLDVRLSPLAEALLAELVHRRTQVRLSPSPATSADPDPLAAAVWARIPPTSSRKR